MLNPVWRVPALAQHISSRRTDIFCLQEVESETLSAIRARLTYLGYADHYARKRGKSDGCAIFYRRDLFDLIGAQVIQFADGGEDRPDSGNIALVGMFRAANRVIGVINAHLTWDPPDTPVNSQLGYCQARQLLLEWEKIAGAADAWIIAGDLNVTPDQEMVAMIEASGFAYAHRGCLDANTCNFNGQAKMIDYLFYSAALRAQPEAVVPVGEETVLPSAEQPSDHVVVTARFEWKI